MAMSTTLKSPLQLKNLLPEYYGGRIDTCFPSIAPTQ